MSKIEIIGYLLLAFMLVCIGGGAGWIFDAAMFGAGILVGAVMWVVLNEKEIGNE
jgi:hypothetical protein